MLNDEVGPGSLQAENVEYMGLRGQALAQQRCCLVQEPIGVVIFPQNTVCLIDIRQGPFLKYCTWSVGSAVVLVSCKIESLKVFC